MVIESAGPTLVDAGWETLIDLLRPFFMKLSVVMGGIFGIYAVLLFARIHYERKKVFLLKDIRFDLDQLNKHYKLQFSKERPTLWRRVVRMLNSKPIEKNQSKKRKKK
jgi:hypothetical protein